MAWINRLSGLLGGKDVECNIVIVGLASCGKSTIMHQIKPGCAKMNNLTASLPQLGFHAERFRIRGMTVVAFNLEDLMGFGNPWEDFYRDCHALVFVVDSSDRFSMPQVKGQLERMLGNPLLRTRKVPLVLLANKMDQDGAVPSLQLSQFLELHAITYRPWYICPSNALTGEGLHDAFDWLAHQLRKVCQRNATDGMPKIAVSHWP